MLIILLKSMFSLPSATIICSPHTDLRLNPFFAFIICLLLKYYDFKKNSIKELISVHGQYFGDIWFEPGEAIAFNPDGSVQYIYQNGSYRVPNNETQESFKIR